jgi:hypothetical protein
VFLHINLFKRFPEVNNLATKKQKAAKRAKKDQETNDNIQKPVEEVKESENKTKKQDKKRK